jgi:hypothetical protein
MTYIMYLGIGVLGFAFGYGYLGKVGRVSICMVGTMGASV